MTGDATDRLLAEQLRQAPALAAVLRTVARWGGVVPDGDMPDWTTDATAPETPVTARNGEGWQDGLPAPRRRVAGGDSSRASGPTAHDREEIPASEARRPGLEVPVDAPTESSTAPRPGLQATTARARLSPLFRSTAAPSGAERVERQTVAAYRVRAALTFDRAATEPKRTWAPGPRERDTGGQSSDDAGVLRESASVAAYKTEISPGGPRVSDDGADPAETARVAPRHGAVPATGPPAPGAPDPKIALSPGGNRESDAGATPAEVTRTAPQRGGMPAAGSPARATTVTAGAPAPGILRRSDPPDRERTSPAASPRRPPPLKDAAPSAPDRQAVPAQHLFADSALEEAMADALERAAREMGIDLS